MKDFVEKLISRLEERKEFHSRLIAYEQKNGTITEEYQQRKAVDVLDDAIEIINQLAEEYKPKTNADKIRSISDEELAEFLEKIVSGDREVIGIDCKNYRCISWKCTECIGVWLKSEAE